MIEISPSQFDMYALALPAGLAFGDDVPVGAWRTQDGLTLATLTANQKSGTFGTLIMRRREDDVWVVKRRKTGIASETAARAMIDADMIEGRLEKPYRRALQDAHRLGA